MSELDESVVDSMYSEMDSCSFTYFIYALTAITLQVGHHEMRKKSLCGLVCIMEPLQAFLTLTAFIINAWYLLETFVTAQEIMLLKTLQSYSFYSFSLDL